MRSRWRRSQKETPLLRVGVLASYTADPLVPYLGVGLQDAGLPAQIDVGPYNQIVQQCADPDSPFARERPDVVVVAPRFEELSAHDLPALADTAVAAARRWASALVFVLPAVPENRPTGAGDAGRVDGVVAGAVAARETLRARLAGVPGVDVTDAEEAVRGVGTARAYRPAMYRLAKVPYSEELFARLAAQVVRVVRMRYGTTWPAVVADVDSLLLSNADPGERRLAADTLTQLCDAGLRLTLRTGAMPAEFWAEFPRLMSSLDDDDPGARTVLLTADPALAAETGGVLLSPDPDAWPAELELAGVLDRAPVPPTSTPVHIEEPTTPMSVQDYIAGLDVRVTFREANPDELPHAVEVIERAKDFSFGIPYAATEPGPLTVVHVRDRYADYGLGGAVRLRTDEATASVDLWALSCPVLGKGVEEHVLRELVDRAAAHGCDTLMLRHHETGANRTSTAFLETATQREWRAANGEIVRVRS
jgi:predicted enzyme involved in methoxymalonyl-ACP biosynthesis